VPYGHNFGATGHYLNSSCYVPLCCKFVIVCHLYAARVVVLGWVTVYEQVNHLGMQPDI